MYPYFELFGRTIGLYPVMALLGAFAAALFVLREGKKHALDANDTIALLLVISLGILAGGHLLYALTNAKALVAFFASLNQLHSAGEFFSGLFPLVGGSVFYGGLFGGLAFGLLYGRQKKLDARLYIDLLTPAIPLFHAFGRIGCFLGGCCYGIESRFGFTYRRALIAEANLVQRFPVQLLEALFNLALFFALRHLYKKEAFKARLFFVYLLIYACGRFFIEFLRGDALRGAMLGFSTSQWISAFLVVSVAMLCVLRPIAKKNIL